MSTVLEWIFLVRFHHWISQYLITYIQCLFLQQLKFPHENKYIIIYRISTVTADQDSDKWNLEAAQTYKVWGKRRECRQTDMRSVHDAVNQQTGVPNRCWKCKDGGWADSSLLHISKPISWLLPTIKHDLKTDQKSGQISRITRSKLRFLAAFEHNTRTVSVRAVASGISASTANTHSVCSSDISCGAEDMI